jgi:branched-chain amino acid transport system substrate-binding protein
MAIVGLKDLRGGITMHIRTLIGALALAVPLAATAQAPVKIYSIVELSGTGATAGTNFDNGLKLAFKEINAAGGILGRKVDVISVDTQSNPATAKAMTQKAVDDGAYVVMGPVFSGSIIVSMAETKKAEIPNFTGGEAASITQQSNPYIFRTSFTQSTAMPKSRSTSRTRLKAKSVAVIWVNNDFGKGGRDSIVKGARGAGHQGRGGHLDRPRPGRLLRRGAEGEAVRTPMRCSSIPTRRKSARALRELKKQGLRQADHWRDNARPARR